MPHREVARALDALQLRGRHLLVAVSGGLDSVALLHLLMEQRERCGLRLSVGHVDHGLRGAASRADAGFVRALAEELGIDGAVECVEPHRLRDGGSSRARPTLQEAARRVRYDALRRMATRARADVIVTAHTADDQAETVLLRLLRGCGPDGLGGIPERSPDGRVARPLLGVTRAALSEWVAARDIRYREDATNASDRYTRNRLRRHWLPQLERSFNPQLLRALANLAEAQRRDAEWIGELVTRELADRVEWTAGGCVILREGWDALPEPIVRRAAKRLVEHVGGGRDLTRRHIDRVVDLP